MSDPSDKKVEQLRSYLSVRCHSVLRGDLVYAYLYGTGSIVQTEPGTYHVTDELKSKINEMTKSIKEGDIVFDRTRGGHYLVYAIEDDEHDQKFYQAVKLTFDMTNSRFRLDMTCRWSDRLTCFKETDPFIRIRSSKFNSSLAFIRNKCKEIRSCMATMNRIARELSKI